MPIVMFLSLRTRGLNGCLSSHLWPEPNHIKTALSTLKNQWSMQTHTTREKPNRVCILRHFHKMLDMPTMGLLQGNKQLNTKGHFVARVKLKSFHFLHSHVWELINHCCTYKDLHFQPTTLCLTLSTQINPWIYLEALETRLHMCKHVSDLISSEILSDNSSTQFINQYLGM